MGKLLTILGISEDKQLRLPKKILQAEKIIAGLQTIYSQSPESSKKDILADTIAETTRLLLAEIGNVKLQEPMPKQEPQTQEPEEQPEEEQREEEQPEEQPEEEQPEPLPQPEEPQPQQPKRKSRKKKEEPQPSAYPENDDYNNWSQQQLTAKSSEIIETIAFFEQNGIDTEELQIELDEINLYIN
jgi:outer membrane biosynthesis protein TonB